MVLHSTVSRSSVKRSISPYSVHLLVKHVGLMPGNGRVPALATLSIQALHRIVSNAQSKTMSFTKWCDMQVAIVLTLMVRSAPRRFVQNTQPVFPGDEYLATLGIKYSERWRDFGVFLAFTVFNAFLAFVSTSWTASNTQANNALIPTRHVTTSSVFAKHPSSAS